MEWSEEEAEEAVLGAMVQGDQAITDVLAAGVQARHFASPARAEIFRIIEKLDQDGAPVDSVTIANQLRERGKLEAAGGVPYVTSLPEFCPSVVNAGHYAKIVLDHATVRRLVVASENIKGIADGIGSADEKVAAADGAWRDALEGDDHSKIVSVGESVKETVRLLETKKPRIGTRTRFADLDKLTTGLHPGQLWIIAARPGLGKSTFVQNIAENVAGDHATGREQVVAFFSLEMGADEIGMRMLASQGKVPHTKLRAGGLNDAELAEVHKAQERLDRLPIYITDSQAATVSAIRAKARKIQRAKGGLALVVIDYIQLMLATAENRQNEVAAISRGLKMLARELEVPVIALSQLSRSVESRENKRPVLADLRDSGAIEQDADLVAFLYREDYYKPNSEQKGTAELIVSKQRSGATGVVNLTWVATRSKFSTVGPAQAESASEVF